MFVLCSLCAPSPFAAIVAMTTGCMLSPQGGERDRDVNEPARPETEDQRPECRMFINSFGVVTAAVAVTVVVVVAAFESFSFAFVALSLRSSAFVPSTLIMPRSLVSIEVQWHLSTFI